MEIVNKFTTHLKDVLTRSLCFCVDNGGGDVAPEHFLWALLEQPGATASQMLKKAGVPSDGAKEIAIRASTQASASSAMPILNADARKVIEKAVLTANIYGHRHIGTEHLLAGLLQIPYQPLQTFFTEHNVRTDMLLRHVSILLKTTALFPDLDKEVSRGFPGEAWPGFAGEDELDDDEGVTALEEFTRELTDPKAVKQTTPIIGRANELERMTHILSRRTKNNPILIGEPGVGKTAIVEGLARQIIQKEAPPALADKRIFQLDLATLIAGTMYRGEFEARLRALIDEIAESDDIILFIDEVHTLMGAGSASGSLDAANILKPALARGTIRCIGATTLAEYKRFIETDGAMERRFQSIMVEEPSLEQTREILAGVQSTYEQFHSVRFQPEAIDAILTLSQRYLTGQQFPDKAIDLLDETGAAVGVRDKSSTPVLVNAQRVVDTVMRIRGLSKDDLARHEQQAEQTILKRLKAHIIGQNTTLHEVARILARPQWRERHRPRASFLFAGPSGVGKTQLAKIIAQTILPNKQSLLRLDMSEYREAYSASKLLGSPAGYVGYRDGNVLADHLKHHPVSAVIFDEMEKAHPDIHNLLLQILEEGELRDSTGKTISFRQATIILTTNVGRERFERGTMGFGENTQPDPQSIRSDLEDVFKQELLNRLDKICLFNPLRAKDATAIIKQHLAPLLAHLQERNVAISIDPSVYKYLQSKTGAKEGARGWLRLIEQEIEPILLHASSGTLKATKNGLRLISKQNVDQP